MRYLIQHWYEEDGKDKRGRTKYVKRFHPEPNTVVTASDGTKRVVDNNGTVRRVQ